MKLFKVKVETDMMVIADNEASAIEIAKKNAVNEVAIYGRGTAQPVRTITDIPEDWKSVIPYSKEGSQETRKCYEMVNASVDGKRELPQEDIEEIMKIKSNSKSIEVPPPIEIKPETRPDPKPKELDWHETKSGRPMKQLRFVR